MKTITVTSEDRVGLLADITYILAKTKVNIDDLEASVSEGMATIRIAVDDREKATNALSQNGYKTI